MTAQEKDRIECAIRHIKSAADVDPWAVEISVEAMERQLFAEGTASDPISRQAAIDYFVRNVGWHDEDGYPVEDSDELRKIWTDLFNGVPSAQAEPKNGRWTEKRVMYIRDIKDAIDAWQSCKCSECGRYDTRPYMYFFVEPRFCSYCGMRMRKETEWEG